MVNDMDTKFNVTVFHGYEAPETFSVGDLWFSENKTHVAKKQNEEIVWVEKR